MASESGTNVAVNSGMALEATSKHLRALLKRIERLSDQLSRTRAQSAEVRRLVRSVSRKIERSRDAFDWVAGFPPGDIPAST